MLDVVSRYAVFKTGVAFNCKRQVGAQDIASDLSDRCMKAEVKADPGTDVLSEEGGVFQHSRRLDCRDCCLHDWKVWAVKQWVS